MKDLIIDLARRKLKHGLISFCFLVTAGHARAVCDQTLNPGANLTSVLAAAPAGSTICLNSGVYGALEIVNTVKSSDVTLQSVSGTGAEIGMINIWNGSHFKFKNLTLNGASIIDDYAVNLNDPDHLTDYITIEGCIAKSQVHIRSSGPGIVVTQSTFSNISVGPNAAEGRLQLTSGKNILVTYNKFLGPGESDGIQNNSDGAIIGPGNIFDGIRQLNYSRHIDSYQGYGQKNTTLTGNLFINGDTYIMTPDGGLNEVMTNNIFIGDGGYYGKIQLGSHANDVFSHNTVTNMGIGFDKKMENTTKSTNAQVRNNIMINASFNTTDSAGVESCSNCLFERNLFSSQSLARGTNNIIGIPTFVGGALPTTFAGYQLTSSSLGYKAGTDGLDLGITFYGQGTIVSPPTLMAPKNLRLVTSF